MTTFLHTSDWHLGMQAHFLPEDARARYTQDRFDAVTRIAEIAASQGCAFVVVAGDVFDSNHVSDAAVSRAIEALRAFTMPVYLLPGNHDCLDPGSVYRSRAWSERKPPLVHVLETTESHVPTAGVEVVGAPILTKRGSSDPLAQAYAVPPPAPGVQRILVGHGMVDYLNPDASDPDVISATALQASIVSGSVAYAALGDRHSTTEIDGTLGRAYYSGSPLVTRYDEIHVGEVLVVELDGDDCDVCPQNVGTWVFKDLRAELHGRDDVNALAATLDALPDKPRTAVKLSLRGTLSLIDSAALDDVLEPAADVFAAVNRWERHTDLAVEPTDEDISALEVSGYVRQTLQDLQARASARADSSGAPSEPAGVARDALNLLYRLAR